MAPGGLLHHPFTLTPCGAVYSLWHCLADCSGWVLPTALPCGARTFLGAVSRHATVQSTHSRVQSTTRLLVCGHRDAEIEGDVDREIPEQPSCRGRSGLSHGHGRFLGLMLRNVQDHLVM